METVTDFIFLGSKITVDGDCSHETKRWLAPWKESYDQPSKSESEVAQLCPTLCNPMDCSLPGSSVHGVFQARILEWVAMTNLDSLLKSRDITSPTKVPLVKAIVFPGVMYGCESWTMELMLLNCGVGEDS